MIPTNDILNATIVKKEYKNKNYKMYINDLYINNYIDNFQAMEQIIYKILNTERYNYIIYSWNYGVELMDLIGKSYLYVCVESERRIKEALLQDDRITSVYNFEFEQIEKDAILIEFQVTTIFGDIAITKAVTI